jgi:hypothetical protein
MSDTLTKPEWIESMVGHRLDEDKWIDSKARSQALSRATEIIASKLESLDYDCHRSKEQWVSVVDGEGNAELLAASKYRHVQFLPSVQSYESRRWCRELQYYIDTHPQRKWCRMWVSTTGERCSSGELAPRLRGQNRRISRMACELRKMGVELLFSAAEFTIRLEKDGSFTYHPHQHLIILPLRFFEKSEWSALVERAKALLGGHHLRDAGKIAEVGECVKYCCKVLPDADSGSIALTDLPASELLALAKNLQKLRLKRAYGLFAQDRSSWKEEKVTPKKVKIKKEPGDEADDVDVDGEEEQDTWEWRMVSTAGAKPPEVPCGSDDDRDIVIGTTISAIVQPVFSRSLLVINYSGNFRKLLAKRYGGRNPLQSSLVPAPAPEGHNVHTSTITVRPGEVSMKEALKQMRQLKQSFSRDGNNSERNEGRKEIVKNEKHVMMT